MTEKEYIRATNKAKIAMMIKISDEIIIDEQYGIRDSEIGPIVRRLYDVLDNLTQMIEREIG